MVGQTFPHPGHSSFDPSVATERTSWRTSSLAVFAAIALAALFAMLLLAATTLNVGADPCEQASSSEACCVAASADAFAMDACRELRP